MFKKAILCVVALCACITVAVAADATVADIPLRLKNAQKGEWVKYNTASGMVQKQTVVHITEKEDDTAYSIQTELSMDGESLQSMTHIFSLNEAIEEQGDMGDDDSVTVTRGTETIDGKDYDTITIETVIEDSTVQTVMSEEIPVTGIIRVVINGEAFLELDSFGEGEA